MFGFNLTEILIVATVLLLLFGAKRLPQLGQALGETVRGFRRAFTQGDDRPGEPPKGGGS